MTKKSSNPPDYRSAITGKFVTPGYAKRHPNTTVKEHNPSPKPRTKK